MLVVEDEFIIRRLVEESLSSTFDVQTVGTLAAAAVALERESFDLVLLDLGLPDGNGIQFCSQLRSRFRLPIIMLTARADLGDVVAGLEAGADDYIVKPFRGPELAARVRAQIRRASTLNGQERKDRMTVGDVVIDDDIQDVLVDGRRAYLTQTEFAILKFLAARAGKAVSREAIFVHVWGRAGDQTNKVLSVYVSRLRKKIEREPDSPRLLRTVHGFGYCLSAKADAP